MDLDRVTFTATACKLLFISICLCDLIWSISTLVKLNRLGINRNTCMLNWIQHFLKGRKTQVRLGDNITKTCLFKYIENCTSKNRKFSDKKRRYIFHISAQNIDCGYSIEPPRRGGSKEYPQSMVLSRNKENNL